MYNIFTAISKAITTSSLSNKDIDQLIDQLLDKMDTNVEVSSPFLHSHHTKLGEVILHLPIHVHVSNFSTERKVSKITPSQNAEMVC